MSAPSARGRADAIVVGAGLAGLVAAAELAAAGKRVILVDQEPRADARRAGVLVVRWALSRRLPEQRRLRIKDSHELAWQDWIGTAGFDRPKTRGRGGGPRRTSTGRPARSASGSTRRASASCRMSAGRSAAATAPRPRQLRSALPRHLGTGPGPDRAVRRRRARSTARRPRRAPLPSPRRPAHRDRRGGRRRRGSVLAPDTRARVVNRAHERSSARSSFAPAR